jgi:hypothetical protein
MDKTGDVEARLLHSGFGAMGNVKTAAAESAPWIKTWR